MDTNKETKIIELYTLAEKDVLIAHLKNAIRWSPWPTYGDYTEFRPAGRGRNVNREIVGRAHDKGIVIRVERIFEPICKSRFQVYDRRYHDDALAMLRLMVKDFPGMLVLRDSEALRKDLDILNLNSPPLYNKTVTLIEKTA